MYTVAVDRALSSILRTPGISILVIVVIALGVGITMPMVTLYSHSGADPLPQKSHRLYRALIDNWHKDSIYYYRYPELPTEVMTPRDALALMQSGIPSGVAVSFSSYEFVGPVERSRVRPFYAEIRVTTRDFFDMFGLPLQYGFIWSKAAEAATRNVAVISHATNQRLFGGGNNLNKQLKVAGQVYTIIGILQPWSMTPRVYDMSQTNARPEGVYVPLSNFRRTHFTPVFFRAMKRNSPKTFDAFLNSETLFAQVWVELDSTQRVTAFRDFMTNYVADQKRLGRLQRPMNNRLYSAHNWINIAPNNRNTMRLYGILVAVGMFFLVVCLLNSLGLLLMKFMANMLETCVIRVLGGSRTLVFLQYVIEVIVLGICGGILSVGVAIITLKGIYWIYIENLPPEVRQIQTLEPSNSDYIQFDTTLSIYTLLIAIVASMASVLYPAWRSCSAAPADYLNVN